MVLMASFCVMWVLCMPFVLHLDSTMSIQVLALNMGLLCHEAFSPSKITIQDDGDMQRGKKKNLYKKKVSKT